MARQKVIETWYDDKGRPNVEFYESTNKGNPCVRFRVIGGNGEKMVPSEGYSSLSNAKRGVRDLFYRLKRLNIRTLNWFDKINE